MQKFFLPAKCFPHLFSYVVILEKSTGHVPFIPYNFSDVILIKCNLGADVFMVTDSPIALSNEGMK